MKHVEQTKYQCPDCPWHTYHAGFLSKHRIEIHQMVGPIEIPPEHYDVIAFYNRVWKKNFLTLDELEEYIDNHPEVWNGDNR
jgi:hypothetical protein